MASDVITLRPPNAADMWIVAEWRQQDHIRGTLRTPYMLTDVQQSDFYENVISNRTSRHRYWSFTDDSNELLAFGGLANIEWENGHAEISLLVDPAHSGKGVGTECVRLILREAFERMRLLTVFGEVYAHNPGARFWLRQDPTGHVIVPRRKWWDGRLHDAIVFWFIAPGTDA